MFQSSLGSRVGLFECRIFDLKIIFEIRSLVSGNILRIKTVIKLPSARMTFISEEYVIALDGWSKANDSE